MQNGPKTVMSRRQAATFGTVRDGWLIEKLERELPTLDSILTAAGLAQLSSRGQGFQVEGDSNKPPISAALSLIGASLAIVALYRPIRLRTVRSVPPSLVGVRTQHEASTDSAPSG